MLEIVAHVDGRAAAAFGFEFDFVAVLKVTESAMSGASGDAIVRLQRVYRANITAHRVICGRGKSAALESRML